MDNGRIMYRVTLTQEERTQLRALISTGHHAAQEIMHAHILLLCDRGPLGPGMKDEEVVRSLSASHCTVSRVRQRFVVEGLDAALVRRPTSRVYTRIVDGDVEARLTAIACSTPPEGRERWTMEMLADKLVVLQVVASVSRSTVQRVLKKTRSSRG